MDSIVDTILGVADVVRKVGVVALGVVLLSLVVFVVVRVATRGGRQRKAEQARLAMLARQANRETVAAPGGNDSAGYYEQGGGWRSP